MPCQGDSKCLRHERSNSTSLQLWGSVLGKSYCTKKHVHARNMLHKKATKRVLQKTNIKVSSKKERNTQTHKYQSEGVGAPRAACLIPGRGRLWGDLRRGVRRFRFRPCRFRRFQRSAEHTREHVRSFEKLREQ